MLFWIIAALLTAGTVVLLLRPLLRPQGRAADRGAYDLAVYRDQLREIDRDLGRGLISPEQAEAARVEISRRMLAAADTTRTSQDRPAMRKSNKRLALALTVLIPVAALAIYLSYGAPGLPSQPFAERDPAEREARQALVAEANDLARRLEQAPDDVAGWVALGYRYTALERHAEAAAAFGRAVGLTEGDPEITGAYAEALVNADDGIVTEQAQEAFAAVLDARPGDPRARYYLALARAQAGDDAGALARWQALAADTPADAPWLPALRQRIVETADRLGIDVAEAMPEPAPPGGVGGPSQADMEAAAQMSEAERAAMVRSMVDGLAARLEQNPDDPEGWLRLGRAYEVLGEEAQAVEAYRNAAEQAPEDVAVLTAYADALLAASGGTELPEEFVSVMERLLALDDTNLRALWFLGVQALAEQRPDEAAALWTRLLAELEPGTPEHEAVRTRLDRLTQGG